jgi:cytochrome b561
MGSRNTASQWGWVAKTLHWTIALLVIGMVIVGLWMDEMPNSPDKVKVYALHKSTGITVLALMLLRVLWRFVDKRPPYPSTMPGWQRALSEASHFLLYVMLFAMPLSGWLYNSASNFPLQWFWLFRLPALSGPDPELKHLAHDIHETGWIVLAVLLAIHVSAALKHHFFDRDITLARMVPGLLPPLPKDPK